MGAPSDPTHAVVVATLAAGAYFLPTILGRRHHNATAIFLLNLFLGWTVLGWIGALIWAATSSERRTS